MIERLRAAEFANALRQQRLIVFLRRPAPEAVDPIVEALLAGGLGIVEFTLDSQDALGTIERWRKQTKTIVGAGTVRQPSDAESAAKVGAQFLVTPGYNSAVLDRALELGVPIIVGAMTPTEIEAAWDHGATFVKLFPGALLGTAYLKTILMPLREIEIVVTGGVKPADALGFLDAGAAAVGVSIADLGPPAEPGVDARAIEPNVRNLITSLV